MTLQLIPALHRATHRVELYLESLDELNVTQAEAHILAHLMSEGDCTVAELHRALGHKRSTLTSILDRLAGRSLITREVSVGDRRTFRIRLTKSGRGLARKVYSGLAAFEGRVVSRFPRAMVEDLVALLDALE